MFLVQALSLLLLPAVAVCDDRLPFSVSGSDILTFQGESFYFAGTNLPGHGEAMIPEGLQYLSVEDIAQWVVDLGLNSVRLTYATQMIDEIRESGDTNLENTLITALGDSNGSKVLGQVLEKNPSFTKDTTRLEVFDAVANAFADKGIIVHLDNHVSRAVWCCGNNDGNAWFGDRDFDVDSWIQSWAWIANHAQANWPSFSSVGLRNELRDANDAEPVDWYTWHKHMTAAAEAVHLAAPDALIFFSGLSYDTYIDPIPLGKVLNGTSGTETAGLTARFVPSEFDFQDKIVLEIHKYDFEKTQDDCPTFARKWYEKGFQALNETDPRTEYTFPMVLSEWGFIQDGTYWNSTTYNRCLIEFTREWKLHFMQWTIAGSYIVRTRNGASTQDDDEAWGLLNHNWTAVRSPVTIENSLSAMIDALQG